MNNGNKRDFSISMLRANIIVLVIGIPVAILQLNLFVFLQGAQQMSVSLLNILLFLMLLIVSVLVHELIHGFTWKVFGKMSSAMIPYGFQWKTLTPYVHLTGPVDVNVYRIGGFMPGFVLGIIPYILSLMLGDSTLLWFGTIHTLAAGGDWLVLWVLRNVKGGTLVEDHPSRAGCYVYES